MILREGEQTDPSAPDMPSSVRIAVSCYSSLNVTTSELNYSNASYKTTCNVSTHQMHTWCYSGFSNSVGLEMRTHLISCMNTLDSRRILKTNSD